MENETLIRLSTFFGLFILFAGIETLMPRRAPVQSRKQRWVTNWGMSIANTLTTRVMSYGLPLLAVGAAMDAGASGWGLFNQVNWPNWVEITIAILFFDFAIWLQHLITHRVPLLWRLHRVHHSDRDLDVSTAIRFHPLEIAISMLVKIGLVYVMGPSAWAIILFEILLNGSALFNHANINLPVWLDRVLRLGIITPDMHRIHHSTLRAEHDSNYGFFLSIWDRIFGTYIAEPAAGQSGVTIGLQWQDDRPAKLGFSLWLPFRK